jgi:type IV pilus modification protein PilV
MGTMELTQRRNRSAGFTLLEIMIALLVFAIGILATVSMQISSLKGNGIARSNTEAAAIASSVVEELRTLPFQDLRLSAQVHQLPDIGRNAVSYTVQDNAIVDNSKLIRVTVGWKEGTVNRTVDIDYILTDII